MKRLAIDCRMHNSSGIGTVIKNTVPALLKNFDCTLIFNADNLYEFEGRYKTLCFSSKIYSIAEQLEFFWKIRNVDLMWSPHFNYPLLLRGKVKRAVTIHDVFHLERQNSPSFFQRIYAKLFLIYNIKRLECIITDSFFSRGRISHFSRLNPNAIHVVYPGVDTDRFNLAYKATIDLPVHYMLYVGNIKPHKNLKILLNSFVILNEEIKNKYKLVLVGKKEGFITADHEIDQIISAKKLHSYVQFTGFVKDEELVEIYKRAALLVFPSRYEGFGLPPIEAMACGVPVLSSTAASLPEVCGNGALFFNPDDPLELTERMTEILTNQNDIRNKLVSAGKERVKSFRWETTQSQYIQLLSSIK